MVEPPTLAENIVLQHLRSGNRFIPLKLAISKLLVSKKEASPENPYLAKSAIAKILFESQVSHLNPYLDVKSNSLLKQNPENKTSYTIKSIQEMPDEMIESGIDQKNINQILTFWEKQIQKQSPQYKSKERIIREFVEFGLTIILQKYEEFFSKLSDDDFKKICDSIKNRKFEGSFAFKILEQVLPARVDSVSRLVLDALMFSSYCLVIGSKSDAELPRKKVPNILERLTKLLMDSQGEDGAWALRNYDRHMMAKDTSLILYLLREIKKTFPEISIDNSKIKKSHNFLMEIIEDLAKSKQKTTKLETEYLLQVDLYTTIQMIAGIYSGSKLLQKDEDVFQHEFVKQFFRYISKLEKDGGYSINENNDPDVETTSFVANTLLGENSFAFSEEKIRAIMRNNFSSLNIISYFYNNMKAITYFLNKGQNLNIVTDSMSALLWCGVWPLSTQLIDSIVKACEKSRRDLEEFKKIPLFEIRNGKLAIPLKLSPLYWHIMPAIHVLHQTILCLIVVNEYLKNPESYWSKVETLLQNN